MSVHDTPSVKVGDDTNLGPESYVTLCGVSSRLVHLTVWPTLAWIVVGLKAMFFITTLMVPVGVLAAAAVELLDVLAAVGVELDLVFELDPQPARATRTTGRTTAENRFIGRELLRAGMLV